MNKSSNRRSGQRAERLPATAKLPWYDAVVDYHPFEQWGRWDTVQTPQGPMFFRPADRVFKHAIYKFPVPLSPRQKWGPWQTAFNLMLLAWFVLGFVVLTVVMAVTT